MSQKISSLNKFFQAKRLSWPLTLSVALHSTFIMALLYFSAKEGRVMPTAVDADTFSAIMVNPALFATSQTTPPAPFSRQENTVSEQDDKSFEQVNAPIEQQSSMTSIIRNAGANTPLSSLQLPDVTAASTLKAGQREIIKDKAPSPTLREVPPKTTSAILSEGKKNPLEKKPIKVSDQLFPTSSQRVTTPSQDSTTQQIIPSMSKTTSPRPIAQRPQVISRVAPNYPVRALALQQEGKVQIKYDVNRNGKVVNIEVLSAHPRNLFERDIRQAMRKWRYKAGYEEQGIVVTFYFRINGTTKIE